MIQCFVSRLALRKIYYGVKDAGFIVRVKRKKKMVRCCSENHVHTLEPGLLVSAFPRIQVNEKVRNTAVKIRKDKKKTPPPNKSLSLELPWRRAARAHSHPVINSLQVSTAFSRQPHFSTDKHLILSDISPSL